MSVLISNRQKDIDIDEKFIEKTGQHILELLDLSDAELSVSFVSVEESRNLNLNYRKKVKNAEVLSFPMNDKKLLGDVVVAPEISKGEAVKENVSLNQRFEYMLTHGILHLKGYTHDDENNAVEMEKMEDMIILELKKEGLF